MPRTAGGDAVSGMTTLELGPCAQHHFPSFHDHSFMHAGGPRRSAAGSSRTFPLQGGLRYPTQLVPFSRSLRAFARKGPMTSPPIESFANRRSYVRCDAEHTKIE